VHRRQRLRRSGHVRHRREAVHRVRPHFHYVGNQRGYVRASADAEQVTADFMAVSDVFEPNPSNVTVSVAKTFAVRDGVPGVDEV
jgi:hypothetical protein